jgi:aminoglycoside phosphotransferase (APT) family kinase protein
MSAVVDQPDTFRDALPGALAAALGDPLVTVRELRQLTGGASRETWFVEAGLSDGAVRPLILRRDPLVEGDRAQFGVEAAVLRAAARAGVPEPEVFLHSDDADLLGAPFVLMEYIEGETLAPRILRDPSYAEARPLMAAQCGEILAAIHGIPLAEFPDLQEPRDAIGSLRAPLDEFSEHSPSFELGLRWLEANRPAATASTVVHGDFRNGNLIVGPDGIRAVLDWELVHRGDPMQDLGYLCARVWRFGGEGPVGGFGSYDDLFAAYERAGGRSVDPAVVLWWEVWSTLHWGAGCLFMGRRYLSGSLPSVEMAAIGRRVREQEYDVLLMIEQQLGRLA